MIKYDSKISSRYSQTDGFGMISMTGGVFRVTASDHTIILFRKICLIIKEKMTRGVILLVNVKFRRASILLIYYEANFCRVSDGLFSIHRYGFNE